MVWRDTIPKWAIIKLNVDMISYSRVPAHILNARERVGVLNSSQAQIYCRRKKTIGKMSHFLLLPPMMIECFMIQSSVTRTTSMYGRHHHLKLVSMKPHRMLLPIFSISAQLNHSHFRQLTLQHTLISIR